MISYRHMPIGRQIILVACTALLLLFVLVTLVVTRLSMARALASTEQSLSQQVNTVRGMLDAYFENIQARGNRQSDFFQKYLQGEVVQGTATVNSGEVNLPELRANGRLLNNNHALLDEFKNLSNTEAAVFSLQDGKLFRAATLLKKDGNYMDGTLIPATDPVALALSGGRDFSGLTVRNGQYYVSVVRVLKDKGGKTIGGLSVRVPLDTELKQIRTTLGAIVSGQTGYVYILRPTGDENTLAEFVLHPSLQGKNMAEAPAARKAIAAILEKKEGTLHYMFADKDGVEREKLVALAAIPGWNWVVGIGSWQAEYLADSYSLQTILILVGVLAAVASGAMIYLLVHTRLRPLQQVVSVIDRMGRGDFRPSQLDGDSHSGNEVLHLAAALDSTGSQIRQLLVNAQGTSRHVGEAANAVESAVREMLASSESGSQAAASMAAAMEQISVSITMVADNARNVVEGTQSSRDTARTGGELMVNMVGELERVAAEIQTSAGQVRDLGQRSQQISGIVNVIREIAEQTNLLALNAAIEAARAGENGRGFAVVADEVRKLAERTAVSTQEISLTIQAIVGDTQTAVAHMEKVSGQMASGVQLAQKTNFTLEAINRQAESSLDEVRGIAAAARQQSLAIQEVAANVERVATLSEENHAVADQNLAQAVGLRQVAEQMKTELGRFEL